MRHVQTELHASLMMFEAHFEIIYFWRCQTYFLFYYILDFCFS